MKWIIGFMCFMLMPSMLLSCGGFGHASGGGGEAPPVVGQPVQATEKERPEEMTPVTYGQLTDKMAAGKDFLLYLGRPDCMDCIAFRPILEEYVDSHSHAGVYCLDVQELREADRNAYEQLKRDFDLQWVPSLYHIVNGAVVSSFQYLSTEYYAIADEDERAAAEERYIEDFYRWMERHTA